MKSLRVGLLIALALLAGCASGESGGWTKPGLTREQLDRDTLQCLTEAQEIAPGGTRVDQTRYQRCMAARGYTAAPGK